MTKAHDANTPQRRTRRRENKKKTNTYSVPIKIRAAYLAGQGRTSHQICAEMGITDPPKLRGLLRTIGVKLRAEATMPVVLSRQTTEALGVFADRADVAPEDMAARIITMMVGSDREILKNLLDEQGEPTE